MRASGYAESLPVDGKSRLPLIEEQPGRRRQCFLSDANGAVVTSFLEDVRNADLLASKGLATRLSMLLAGPPGTGKTSWPATSPRSLGALSTRCDWTR